MYSLLVVSAGAVSGGCWEAWLSDVCVRRRRLSMKLHKEKRVMRSALIMIQRGALIQRRQGV